MIITRARVRAGKGSLHAISDAESVHATAAVHCGWRPNGLRGLRRLRRRAGAGLLSCARGLAAGQEQ